MTTCDYCKKEKRATHNIQTQLVHYSVNMHGDYTQLDENTETLDDVNVHLCDKHYEQYMCGKLEI